MPQKIYFSCFLGKKTSESQAYVFNSKLAAPEPILAEIWPAYCQIVFLKNRAGDFCFLFLFSNNHHFFKGSADDLSPPTLSMCHKRTNTRVKNLRHGFLVECVKKQMRYLSFSQFRSFLAGLELNLHSHMLSQKTSQLHSLL